MATETGVAQRVAGRRADVLVAPEWLEEHLHDPLLRLVEVDVSQVSFGKGHIDGAVLWNIYRDLKDTNYETVDRSILEQLVRRSGIAPQTTVVFYGYAPALGFWLMKLFGHADVRILDCSRGTWREEGRPWTTEVSTPDPTVYRLPDEDPRIRVRHPAVQRAIGNPLGTLLDVRSPQEYRGERFWPSGAIEEGGRAGHIPSAVNLPIDDLHDGRGAFRTDAELRQDFSTLDLAGDAPIISYCTVGGRACTAWFALTQLLGRANVSVYDGSWAEWGRMPEKPVDVG